MCRGLKINTTAETLEPNKNISNSEIVKGALVIMEGSVGMMIISPNLPLTVKFLQEGISEAVGSLVEGLTISKILKKRLIYCISSTL